MFIQTEAMPDPADLKFLPGRRVMPHGTLQLDRAGQAERSPLARRLFGVPGVTGVVLGPDYITVTGSGADWLQLKPMILGAIMDHFMSGDPVIAEPAASAQEGGSPGGLAEDVRHALCGVIDPELGHDIVGLGLVYEVAVDEGGGVRVIMTTTTPGCPATSYLVEGARDATLGVPGVDAVEVTLTYEPRWTPEMMSEEAKARFGIRDGGGW